MPLALSAIRHAGAQFVDAVTTPLTSARCRIGRGQECDIVLEDPTRRVSRDHASINRQGDSYVLTVNSRVNPVTVNENILTAGQSVVLSVGDEIAIGDYVFTVVNVEAAGESAPGAAADLFGASPRRGGAGRTERDAVTSASTLRIDSVQPGRSTIDDRIGGHSQRAEDPLPGIPDGGSMEFDHVNDISLPFSPPETRRAPVRAAAPRSGLAPAVKDDPLAALFGESEHPQRAAGTAGDPSDLLSEARSGRESAANGDFDGTLQEPTYVIRPPAPDAAARQTGPSPAVAGISMAQAVQAFLQGAAMESVQVSDEEAEAFLREGGAVCRAAIEGLMGLLLARATVKDQLRISDRTMAAAGENNALKLIENVDEAVKFVFDRSSRTGAFLPPDKAVADACTDLQVHEIALVAGMRSALTGAIRRFNPAEIEQKLDQGGGGSMLASKKAKLWDTFLVYYEDTARDAEDNFDRVFGPDFLRAYQEQLKRRKG